MDTRKAKEVRARFLDGAIPRIIEGVTIGLVVAAILLAKDYLTNHWDRQDEITYIRAVIVSARLDISKAQAGPVAIFDSGKPLFNFTPSLQSRRAIGGLADLHRRTVRRVGIQDFSADL